MCTPHSGVDFAFAKTNSRRCQISLRISQSVRTCSTIELQSLCRRTQLGFTIICFYFFYDILKD